MPHRQVGRHAGPPSHPPGRRCGPWTWGHARLASREAGTRAEAVVRGRGAGTLSLSRRPPPSSQGSGSADPIDPRPAPTSIVIAWGRPRHLTTHWVSPVLSCPGRGVGGGPPHGAGCCAVVVAHWASGAPEDYRLCSVPDHRICGPTPEDGILRRPATITEFHCRRHRTSRRRRIRKADLRASHPAPPSGADRLMLSPCSSGREQPLPACWAASGEASFRP